MVTPGVASDPAIYKLEQVLHGRTLTSIWEKITKKVRAGVVSVEMADTVVLGDMHPGRGRGQGRGRGGRPASCTMPEAPVRPEATTIQGGEAADQAPLLERPDSKCAAQSADPQTPTRRHTLTPRSSRSPPNCRVAAPAPGLVLSGPGRREHSARHRGCGPETRPAAR